MVNLSRLKSISQLNMGDFGSNQSGGAELDSYVEKLTAFTDALPELSDKMRDALADGDTGAVTQNVTTLRDMLFQIGADKLAAEFTMKIAEFSSMSAGSLEAAAEALLGSVSALSIDIQMAIYSGDTSGSARKPGGAGTPDSGTGEPSPCPIILAVDDNAFFLSTLKSYLQNESYKLTCVNAGSVALRFLEKHTPDLFILDIDMPEMDGYELAAQIREKGFSAPIIFLTGNASKDYVIKAVKAGAADFIIKPISKEQALEKVARYV